MSIDQVGIGAAAWTTLILAAGARWLVIRFNWRTRPAREYRAQDLIKQVPGELANWPRWTRRTEERRPESSDTPLIDDVTAKENRHQEKAD
ncbi:MAG: hypothetical protein R3C44_14540 [Chloroflexota bacterium]